MNRVRFDIGIPKGGSAARIAEDSVGARSHSMRPQGGSAARDAEERKKLESNTLQRSSAIGLRAQGGRVVTAEELRIASVTPHVSPAEASRQAQQVSVKRVEQVLNGADPIPPVRIAFQTDTPVPERAAHGNVLSQPLQAAAIRVKSLVQSLFSLDASSSKP